MTPSLKQRLQQERADLTKEVEGILALAQEEENRDLTEQENNREKEIDARVQEIDKQLAVIQRQEERERGTVKLAEWMTEGDTKATGEVEPPEGFNTFGEMLQAVYRAGIPDSRGPDERLFAAATGLGEGVLSDGGFLVDKQREGLIREKVYNIGQILQRTDRLPIGAQFNGVKIPAINETSRADGSRFGGIRGYWLAEGDSITASKPTFRLMELELHKLGALVYITEELLRDTTALEAYVNSRVPMELSFMAEDSIVNGTGAGKPLGFLNSGAVIAVSAETGQASSTIVYENVLNMWTRMWAPSRSNAVWLVDQSVEPQLYTMSLTVGTGGAPVYLPAGGASSSPFASLFGRPVIPIEYGAALGTAGDIMLVDLSQYTVIDKGAIEAASSIHVRFIYDEMAFRFIWRIDGQPQWNSALTPKSGGDSLSAFISLAAR